MSTLAIEAALEERLKLLPGLLPVLWENGAEDAPVDGAPYLEPYTMHADPANPALASALTRYTGVFQVRLSFPPNAGRGDASAYADKLQSWFFRGLSCAHSGVIVIIDKTPEIRKLGEINGRNIRVVRATFFCDVEG